MNSCCSRTFSIPSRRCLDVVAAAACPLNDLFLLLLLMQSNTLCGCGFNQAGTHVVMIGLNCGCSTHTDNKPQESPRNHPFVVQNMTQLDSIRSYPIRLVSFFLESCLAWFVAVLYASSCGSRQRFHHSSVLAPLMFLAQWWISYNPWGVPFRLSRPPSVTGWCFPQLKSLSDFWLLPVPVFLYQCKN